MSGLLARLRRPSCDRAATAVSDGSGCACGRGHRIVLGHGTSLRLKTDGRVSATKLVSSSWPGVLCAMMVVR